MSFPENVFRVMNRLQKEHRFVPARAMNHRMFAALMRKETEEVFLYLLVHDGRPGGANVDVHLWVAPPECPGDSLDNLYVGYKVLIASEYEVDDIFFLNSERRIINFLPCVSGIIPSIISEMENPAFDTLRWRSYQLQRNTFNTFMQDVKRKNKIAMQTIEAVRHLALGKGKYEQIEQECRQIAIELMEEGKLDKNVINHYQSKPERIGSSIARQLYAQVLGELSESRKVQ